MFVVFMMKSNKSNSRVLADQKNNLNEAYQKLKMEYGRRALLWYCLNKENKNFKSNQRNISLIKNG